MIGKEAEMCMQTHTKQNYGLHRFIEKDASSLTMSYDGKQSNERTPNADRFNHVTLLKTPFHGLLVRYSGVYTLYKWNYFICYVLYGVVWCCIHVSEIPLYDVLIGVDCGFISMNYCIVMYVVGHAKSRE